MARVRFNLSHVHPDRVGEETVYVTTVDVPRIGEDVVIGDVSWGVVGVVWTPDSHKQDAVVVLR